MRLVAVLLLPLSVACGGNPEPRTAGGQQSPSPAGGQSTADRLCAEAAGLGRRRGRRLPGDGRAGAGAHGRPHGAAENPSAPLTVGYDFPDGWDAMQPADATAACYLDGPVPKGPPPAAAGSVQPSFDRRLVIAGSGVRSFMVSAGYQHALPLEPLGR